MKILHVINNLGAGGAEKIVKQLTLLISLGGKHKVDILLLTDKGNVFDRDLKNKGIKISIIPLRKPRNPLNIFFIRNFILYNKYDIVHAHLFPTLYWVSIASKLIFGHEKPRFFFTEHSTYNRRRGKKVFRFFDKVIYSIYDRIISVSKKTHENLAQWLRAKKDNRFVIIPNGVDIEHFKRAAPYKKQQIDVRLTESIKMFCMVGRVVSVKLSSQFPSGAEMV